MDWTLSDKGELKFHDELLPGSCRPWVTLERRTRQVAARANVPFRFQIDVPADAPRGECRFMIALEGIEPAQQSIINSGGASLSLPVSGRIAVTVYLAVGGAKPQLELLRIGSDSVRAQRATQDFCTNMPKIGNASNIWSSRTCMGSLRCRARSSSQTLPTSAPKISQP